MGKMGSPPLSCRCLVGLFLVISTVSAKLPPSVRVGSVFLEKEQDVHESFRLGVVSLKSRQLLNETDIAFDIQYATPHDYFHLYTRACVEVGYGIISLFGPSDPALDEQLVSISNALGIPLISSAPRPRMGRSANGGGSSDLTLSLHPTQSHLVRLIKDLAMELKWKDISIIHDPLHGIIEPTALAESLQMLGSVSVHQASTDLRATLVQLRLKGARNIIIDTASENIQTVLQATLDTGMMTKSYSYIFTMLDMKCGNWSRLSYSEALVFGFNIIDEKKFQDFQDRYGPTTTTAAGQSSTRVALTLDAVELLARGLEAFDDSGTDLSSLSAASCTGERKWEIGEELKDAFTTVSYDGITGPISFSNGLRSRVTVDVVKLQYNNEREVPTFLTVGNWSQGNLFGDTRDGLQMLDRSMLTNEKRDINKTIVITTMASTSCFIKSDDSQEEDEGYCVDLAQHLSKLLGFYYKFKLVGDGRYGKPDPLTGQWDGMIGEVMRGEADMALADLTVTAARSKVIDFSAPFMDTSLAILYKNMDISTDGVSTLLSPFSIWVWVSIGLAFFVTSVCLRLVAWLSPFQKDDIIVPGSESPNLGQDLSWLNSMWLLASTLVLRGSDIRLQAASSRTIAVVWWLFSLLILIIYASLVSHWFDPGSLPPASNIEGLLKNPNVEIGVIRGGSTNYFLQNVKREDLQRVWWRVQRSSETRGFQPSVQSGIDEVSRASGQFAFMSEERNFKKAMSQDCSLRLVGGIDTRSFAAVVPKGSDLREKISQGILTLRETGVLHQLEAKWWSSPSCIETGGKPQVQLINFIGPLTILVFGILVALILAMTERLFHRRRSHRGFFRTSTETGNGKIAINTMDTESS